MFVLYCAKKISKKLVLKMLLSGQCVNLRVTPWISFHYFTNYIFILFYVLYIYVFYDYSWAPKMALPSVLWLNILILSPLWGSACDIEIWVVILKRISEEEKKKNSSDNVSLKKIKYFVKFEIE